MDAGRPVDGGPDRTWRLGLAGGALVAVVALVSRGCCFTIAGTTTASGAPPAISSSASSSWPCCSGCSWSWSECGVAESDATRGISVWHTILFTLFLVGAIAIASPFIRRRAQERTVGSTIQTITIESSGCGSPCPTEERSPGASPWWIMVAAGVLAGVLLVVGARASKGADRETPLPDHARARSLFDASLDDLLAEPDPRRAITMAYGRLLDGLAACGLAHAYAETPYEHLSRTLSELDVAPDPLARLTSLFSEARFSDHALTSVHKDAAIEAFRAARDSLAPHVEHARS